MSESLREQLEAAFEADDQKVTPEETSLVSEIVPDSEPIGRARDEAGKFAARQEPDVPGELMPKPEPQQEPEIKAPSSWKPEAKAAYIKAERGEALTPQEIKVLTAEANRRESDFLVGIGEFKSHAQKARQFEQAIAPYQQTLSQLGLDAPTAINKLLEADHKLRYSDPIAKAQYFQNLAQQYGIDLGQVQNIPQQDPQTQYLMQQLNELRQTQQMWQNSIQEQERSKANHELEQFAGSDKTHFEAVRGDMADLLEAGKAQSLEQAYEMAIWMRPDVRQTLIEQQRIEAQRNYEQQQRTQRAKTASVSVKGSSPSSGGSQPPSGDLRALLESQFAQ
jgi:hypothetical protein